jgi:two-component system sensor histidine kinase PhoQ
LSRLKARFSSIAARLLLASAVSLPLFLGLTGFFLNRAFENSLNVAESSRLRGHINLLFSVAEPDIRNNKFDSLKMPLTLGEADFEHPNSGLYGYIYNGQEKLVWHSNSAALRDPPPYDNVVTKDSPGQLVFSEQLLEKKLHFKITPANPRPFILLLSTARRNSKPNSGPIAMNSGAGWGRRGFSC